MLQEPQWGVEDSITLHVSHSNLKARFPEIKFSRRVVVEQLKLQLSQRCGTSPSYMQLFLRDESGSTVAEMANDAVSLEYYCPQNGWEIHIVDFDPSSASAQGCLEDLSMVEKYVMPDEEYGRREGTVRQFKKILEAQGKIEYKKKDVIMEDISEFTEGSRCAVMPGEKRGEIRFVGEVNELPSGYWVGVVFDEPVGKNDGSYQGIRHFTCEPGYGGFARPKNVLIGDYPPLDILEEI